LWKVVAAFVATCGIATIISIFAVFVRDGSWLKVSDPWKRAIERLVLSFSDQQLVTGLAVLLVGYIGLPVSEGQISVLDFINVTNLAWFSGITHLITMFVLRDYFRDPAHSVLRAVRLTSMIAFGLFLIVSLAVTSRRGFGALNCPAKCVFQHNAPAGFNVSHAIGATPVTSELVGDDIESKNILFLTFSLIFLVVGYLLAIIPTFECGCKSSFAMDILIVSLNLLLYVLALWQIFGYRAWAQQLIGNQEENVWGFGQILPLLLLLLPVLQGLEILYGNHQKFSLR
jgi:hypothetical protein